MTAAQQHKARIKIQELLDQGNKFRHIAAMTKVDGSRLRKFYNREIVALYPEEYAKIEAAV